MPWYSIKAGWSEARRANVVALGVVAVNVIAYCFLGLGHYDPPTADGAMRFTLIALGFYAIPWAIGRGAHDLDRWMGRRELSEREIRRAEVEPHRRVGPPAPRHPLG